MIQGLQNCVSITNPAGQSGGWQEKALKNLKYTDHCRHKMMLMLSGAPHRAHLEPGGELLELREGAPEASINIRRAQAGLVVGEAQQRFVDGLWLQRLAPPLARAPVAPLARPVHLRITRVIRSQPAVSFGACTLNATLHQGSCMHHLLHCTGARRMPEISSESLRWPKQFSNAPQECHHAASTGVAVNLRHKESSQ